MKRQSNTQPSAPEIDDDPVPENIDEFRYELARRISKFVANKRQAWRGCPERSCRRMRACAAPRVQCSNALHLKPDVDGRRAARVSAQIQRALREHGARREAEKER
jgi:hypothetical protein